MIKVIFLLPGEIFSNNFLRSWTRLLLALPAYGVEPQVRWAVGSNIYKIRNEILIGDQTKGPKQKPFQDTVKYDYLMWIDSDQVFEPEDFKLLLQKLVKDNKKSIVSGVYLRSDNTTLTSVIGFQHPDFPGRQAGYLTPADLKGKDKPIPVEFTGMGFMLVRYGVFECLDYPWFVPLGFSFNNQQVVGYTNEDASFCKRARDNGFETYIDPKVFVGHEKSVILR